MNKENTETGTKGTMGTPHSNLTRTRENDAPWGLNEDCDLKFVPDGEVTTEGSNPINPLPFFPQNACWPRIIQQIVDKGKTTAQRDILLLGAINVIGSTLGAKVRTLYNGKWLSPCMMLFVVAPPASGKGILSWLRHIVQPFHDELLARWKREMEAYRTKKLKFDYMGKERANLPPEDMPTAPVRRFFIIPGNNSGTGMQANIINSGGRGIIFEPEADTLSTALNTDYGHFDDALRKTFDHERICFYRRTEDESREVEKTYLSVLLSGTPAQVARLIPTSENGLFSRFLFYYMPPVREWLDQFKETEDLDEWFIQQAKAWKDKLDTLKDVSYFTFQLEESQQDLFNFFMGSIFSRAQHAMGEEATSIVVRLAPQMLRIMSVVALLRCLESNEGLVPDSDIPPENVQDGICPRYTYGISTTDFTPCLLMLDTLFRHAMHVLSLLPAVEVTNRGSADKEALFSFMSDTFTRQEYLEKAGELNISENTALQWIKRGLKKGLIVKVNRGVYQFTARTYV